MRKSRRVSFREVAFRQAVHRTPSSLALGKSHDSTARSEEALQQQLTLSCADASDNLRHRMRQPTVTQQVIHTAHCPRFVVPSSKHHTRNTGSQNHTGAHHAGFERHSNGAAIENSITEGGSGLTNRDHLGMASGVMSGLASIVADPQHAPVSTHDDSSHRNFPRGCGPLCLMQSQPHEG